MKKIKIRFARIENRKIGLLCDDDHAKELIQEWQKEDREKMFALCEEMGISVYDGMWYELALKLARELYPEKKKSGRPLKWGDMELTILAIEVDRLIDANDKEAIERATKKLSKLEPWKSFLDETDSDETSNDPAAALRKRYYEAQDNVYYKMRHGMVESLKTEDGLKKWEQYFVKSIGVSKYPAVRLTKNKKL